MSVGVLKWGRICVAVALACFFAPRAALATVTGTITITGNHTMTDDRYGSINIGADNVVLDCQGHQIHSSSHAKVNCSSPTSSAAKCAVTVMGRSNVTIRNCEIVGTYSSGIYVSGSSNVTIGNTTVGGTRDAGARLYSSSGVVLDGVDLADGSGHGILMTNTNVLASDVHVYRNALNGIVNGTYVERSGTPWCETNPPELLAGQLIFEFSSATENGGIGIMSCASRRLSIYDSTLSGNGGDGLRVVSLLGLHEISSSTFSNNGGSGINIENLSGIRGFLNYVQAQSNLAWDLSYARKSTDQFTGKQNVFGTIWRDVPAAP